jgi:hypothetical protein
MHVAAPPYLKSINAKKKATACILFCFIRLTLCVQRFSVNLFLHWF